MKHRRPFQIPPQMLPHKEKDMLKIIKDPEAFKRVMELQQAAITAQEKSKAIHAFGWSDWSTRIISILPEKFKDNKDIVKAINDLVETLKENYDDTPDEFKERND